MKRSTNIMIAAVLTALYYLQNVIRGAIAIATQDQNVQEMGNGFIVLIVVVSTIGLVSAYGVWQNQKWGKFLAIASMSVTALLALPGVIFAPTLMEKLNPGIDVLVAIIVIILLLQKQQRKGVAA